tara:strand:- start:512 stop:1159 length:648 start_codon:yes stop_codon:yes gene_type:complete
MDDTWDFNFDYEHDMSGQWNNRHTEMEILLKTYDGTQHLRLHGWLKRNDVLIKMESFANKGDEFFGSFIVYITEKTLNKLKKENTEKGLFLELKILSGEEARWEGYKGMDNIMKLDEGIKDFLFSIAGSLTSKKDVKDYVKKANELSIKMFRKNPSYVNEYVESNDMTYKDKIKDIDMMIEYFEEREKYEDCAFLMTIKQKVEKRELLIKIQGNE